MMKVTRRQFVKGGVTAFTVGFVAPSLLTEMASAQGARERSLVVLSLDGGYDSLSVVIPYKDPHYYSRRPTIAIPAAQVLPIGTDADNRVLGFHPRLTGLKSLYDQGKCAVGLRVGYENSSRSHFTGMDIWQTADPKHEEYFGWLGRWLDSRNGDTLQAINTTGSTPRLLLAPIYQTPAIPNATSYSYRTNNSGPEGTLEKTTAHEIASHVPVNRPHVALVQKSMQDLMATLDRVKQVAEYKPSLTYPANGLGNALKMVAGAIMKGTGTKIFFVQLGGFDTHAGQGTINNGYFDRQMIVLNDALAAFYQDLANQGAINDTLIMTFSEFGRRIAENSGGGTDHGAANALFVLGGTVKGGLYGTAPDLNPYPENPTLESRGGDVRYGIDFRSVYATIADNWLNASSQELLGGNFRQKELEFV